MKKTCWLLLAALLCMLLCACENSAKPEQNGTNSAEAETTAEFSPPTQTEAPQQTLPPFQLPQLGSGLAATWVNAGQYSEGRDFVETLTINPDGTILVHLDYQGKPYSDLSGTLLKQGDVLTFSMSDGTVRTYRFELDANILTLSSEERTVTYRRSD